MGAPSTLLGDEGFLGNFGLSCGVLGLLRVAQGPIIVIAELLGGVFGHLGQLLKFLLKFLSRLLELLRLFLIEVLVAVVIIIVVVLTIVVAI